MKRSDLTEFAVEEEGFKLKIRRGASGSPVISGQSYGGSASPFPTHSAPAPAPAAAPAPAPVTLNAPSAPAGDETGIIFVKSPMVGTFYKAASPESKSFAEPGTKISETSVVCIIEAMKIMNELESEYDGIVREIGVTDAHPVEYGQVLFRIDPTG